MYEDSSYMYDRGDSSYKYDRGDSGYMYDRGDSSYMYDRGDSRYMYEDIIYMYDCFNYTTCCCSRFQQDIIRGKANRVFVDSNKQWKKC